MAGWANSHKLLLEEVIQRRDEGVVVPVKLQARIDALHWAADAWNDQLVDPLPPGSRPWQTGCARKEEIHDPRPDS